MGLAAAAAAAAAASLLASSVSAGSIDAHRTYCSVAAARNAIGLSQIQPQCPVVRFSHASVLEMINMQNHAVVFS